MPIDLTPIVKPINDLAEPLTNSLSDAWSAVLGDKIAAWRLRNAAATQVKLHDELKRMGVSLNHAKIPERYAFAWFDEATKQDEPEIQELFARLLAKAAAGDKDAGDRRNLEMLTSLTPTDAKIMDWAFGKFDLDDRANEIPEHELWQSALETLGNDAPTSLEHIVTLGILERRYHAVGASAFSMPWMVSDRVKPAGPSFGVSEPMISIQTSVGATFRGSSLYYACSPLVARATPAEAN